MEELANIRVLRYDFGLIEDGTPEFIAAAEKRIESRIILLATIAREAEARAAERLDLCYQFQERALKAEAMCEWLANLAASNFSRDPSVRRKKAAADLHAASEAVARHDTVDNVLDAAREAVKS